MGNFHHRALMIFASVSAYTAPALMTVCLITDYWIHGDQARLSQDTIIKAGDARILNFTYHRIGLWRECMKETTDMPYTCELVKYSKAEAKLEKGFKAISYRSAPSVACFTAASFLLIIAIFLFTRGLCKRRRKAVFFISGLLFSISGLLTMVGVILYVSIVTEESVKVEQDRRVMEFFYGYSFICAIFSFVSQELTSVLTVYWFIYRFRALVRKQEKLRERTRQLMGNCLSMTTALPLNLASTIQTNHLNQTNSQINHLNQNNIRYPYVSNTKQQRKRIPFEKSCLPSPLLEQQQQQQNDKISSYTTTHSPIVAYKDYCRVLIRAEDMDLLTQMVKSKSQAQLLANSRPTTPASIINTKISTNLDLSRQNIKKGVKRTTSV